ncbi:MAG: insulinase family protein, partial [Epsilonproteobacteria bacterium]|nr:insulinase family protein [Campylobacterota bacterium]
SIVKRHGGVDNASTGFDYTHYFIKTSTQNLPMALGLFAEVMENLNLKEDEFERERKVVAEERRWRTDNNPIGYLYFRLFNEHYIRSPYHWTPIGFMEDIQSWSIDDLREFHKRYYSPNNAILVIAGDINPKDAFKIAKEKFEHIKSRSPQYKCALLNNIKTNEPPKDGAKRVIINKNNNRAETIAIAFSIPNFKDKDQVALSVISEILSNGKSSRLYKSLVEEKQIANQVYGYNMELIDPGVFIFFAVANPNVKAEDLEKAIKEEIERLKNTLVTKEELKRVKLTTKVEFIHQLESSSSTATLFGSYLARGDIKPLLEYEDNLDKITPEVIQEVAKKYFDFNRSTTIILRRSK